MTKTTTTTVICGKVVQHDASGVGHCWRTIGPDYLPGIVEEISTEIIEGGQDECEDYVASNGQHYRWYAPCGD